MAILIITILIPLPIILLLLVVKLFRSRLKLMPTQLTNRTFVITLCAQLISLGFFCLSSEYYIDQCSMCDGDGIYLLMSFTTSFILLLSLGINLSISQSTTHPIITTLTNYLAIIPYYLFSVITFITTYTFTVEPIFH